MAGEDSERSAALTEAGKRRIELKLAVSQVEIAASSPSGDPKWNATLVTELEDLGEALSQHVEEVEAADGLLAELIEIAPRLVNQIGQVRDEHPVLCAQVSAAITQTKSEDSVDAVRAEVLELLLAISRHRQRGADLVYEGYNVDIGGG
ncbi:MAG: hypothetical protein V3V01_18850 [Acidimicrobiales bacterium]